MFSNVSQGKRLKTVREVWVDGIMSVLMVHLDHLPVLLVARCRDSLHAAEAAVLLTGDPVMKRVHDRLCHLCWEVKETPVDVHPKIPVEQGCGSVIHGVIVEVLKHEELFFALS